MKTMIRIAVLCLVMAGTYTAGYSSTHSTKAGFGGIGSPAPVCDPTVPDCQVTPK